ncbi:MAG: Abi family protein [Mycobacteriaceae bacterium]|uniref:Abi family protein n=1 Tax=Corynebacterium sp. TaxID=1720 RepID=UPI003F99611B
MSVPGISASSPYDQPWLSIDEQIDHLAGRGLEFASGQDAAAALHRIGYFRLTGYLHPFLRRTPDGSVDPDAYVPGTALDHVLRLVDADRRLRQIMLDGVDRIEVSLRMRLGHTLGEIDPFAHFDTATFDPGFVRRYKHGQWLADASDNHLRSREQFVAHYADKYNGDLPIWALVELLGLGQLATLYDGLRDDIATPVAADLGVPDRDLLRSWLAAVNDIRNAAAHHVRLFNRFLVIAPMRPRNGSVPLLSHLVEHPGLSDHPTGGFRIYNVAAVMAYLTQRIDPSSTWTSDTAEFVESFPRHRSLGVDAMGFFDGWHSEELWRR